MVVLEVMVYTKYGRCQQEKLVASDIISDRKETQQRQDTMYL
jgi:hypothetical protein